MKKTILLTLLLVGILFSATAQCDYSLRNFPDNKVMVVAHRGNWRQAPENSVWAIKKAIEHRADMAEIDLKMTKDSVIILMHDRTIDRTTTGKGKPQDYTLAELKEFYLRDGAGHATRMRIPTLEEVLQVAKDKIFLNLDQGFAYIAQVFPLLEKYDMMDQVLYKGDADYETFNQKYGHLKDQIIYMPIIRLEKLGSEAALNRIDGFMQHYVPYGFEFTVGETEEHFIDFSPLREKGVKVWVNSLWYNHNAGHHDDVALENPNLYDWYIDNNVNIIQTDRVDELVEYLQKRGLKR